VWVTDTIAHQNGGLSCWTRYGNSSGYPDAIAAITNGHPNAPDLNMLGTRPCSSCVESFPTARHLDTMNTLFVDGHVKAMKLGQLRAAASTNANAMKFFTIEDD
jgi:prepilin-type processing-associated H-X9-DG protein